MAVRLEEPRQTFPVVLRQEEKKGGGTLRGVYRCGGQDPLVPVVIFAHGLGSISQGEKALAFEAACARRGWAMLAVDFRGHGSSDPSSLGVRATGWLEDLILMVREARRRSGGPLFLVGVSLGGWAAAWLTLLHPQLVAACALIAPVFHLWDWLPLTPSEWTTWAQTGRHRLLTRDLDLALEWSIIAETHDFPLETLHQRFHHPAILFHGMADEIIPVSESLLFAERCPSRDIRLCLSKGGDHRLTREKEWLARESCQFFAQWGPE
jgi:pimeloyl-ACP methyl ester carboxylesterase